MFKPSDVGIVLNQGAGAGNEWHYLEPVAKRIRAVDINPQNGYEANKGALSAPDKVEYIVGSASNLSHIEDGSVSIAYQRLFWQHLPEEQRRDAGKEMVRVLKPGGLVIAEDIDFSTAEQWPNNSLLRCSQAATYCYVGTL